MRSGSVDYSETIIINIAIWIALIAAMATATPPAPAQNDGMNV